MFQLDLEDPGNPNNVDWYKVSHVEGMEDTLMTDSELIVLDKKRGKSEFFSFAKLHYLRCRLNII